MTVTRSSKRAARTGLSYPIPIPPSNSASTLSTLPFEILYRILSHLDTASALSLAQVAKAFGSSTEQAIWENVDFLTVYLNAPYVGLPDESDIRTYQEDEAWRAAAKEEDYRKLRRRYQAMANAADPRRWKMVKIVQAVTGEAVNDHLADLLVKVSETLNYLHLDYPNETSMTSDDFVEQSLYRIDSRLQLGGSLLSFPKLTYLHLGQDTIDSMAFIHFLCQASPNLLSLDFTFRSGDPDAGYLATPPPPRLKHLKTPTKIRYLRVDYDYTMGVDGSEESDDEAICELLDFCPLLRRLDLPSRNEFMWGATDVEVAGSWKDQAAVESVEYIRVEHHDIEYPVCPFLHLDAAAHKADSGLLIPPSLLDICSLFTLHTKHTSNLIRLLRTEPTDRHGCLEDSQELLEIHTAYCRGVAHHSAQRRMDFCESSSSVYLHRRRWDYS